MKLLKTAAALLMLASPVLAQTTGTAPSAPNSGAGIAGQPGSKNGPAAKSGSGQNSTTSLQDASKVQGKPGSKSGPAVKPPSNPGTKP